MSDAKYKFYIIFNSNIIIYNYFQVLIKFYSNCFIEIINLSYPSKTITQSFAPTFNFFSADYNYLITMYENVKKNYVEGKYTIRTLLNYNKLLLF